MAVDKENVNTTNRQRPALVVKPGQKKNLLSKDKPQVKKTEVSKQIHHPPEENSQPRTRRVQESQDKEKLQSMVQQWRAERQARLMSRLMKKTGHGGYSSAVFGTVPALNGENHASISKKIKEKSAPKTVDPATRRSTVHEFRPRPEALKTPRKPPQKALNIEERRSTMHTFAARSATVPPKLPSRTISASRLRPARHGTVSMASKEIKETIPKKAPNVDGPKPNSVVKGKVKPLIIRHTLASRLRMEKANPLIGLNIPSLSLNAVNAESTLDPNTNKPGPSNARQSRSTSVPAAHKVNVSHPKTPSKVMINNPQKTPVASHIVPKKSTLAGSSQKETASLEKPKASGRKSVYGGVTSKISSRPSSIRRSLSSTYLDRLDKGDAQKYVIRSQSEPNIKDADENHSSMKFQGVPSPIKEEEPSPREAPMTVPRCKKSVTFVSPLVNTPGNCYTPEPEVLRKRLVDWLSKRGKSLDNYHHLNCFGIHAKSMSQPRFSLHRPRTPLPSKVSSTAPQTPETPVNLNETMTLESASESSGETKMETEAVSPIQRSPLAAISLNETVTTSTPHSSPLLDEVKSAESQEKENVDTKELFIPETLGDLYKLIQLGYPRDQCDEWLVLIRRANKGITNMPQYWECLAALEEARGDFSAAIDCYGRAVVRGAETTKIEASLEVLWDKFSALNVTNTPKKTPSKRKTLDPKQVFTSSIIKFALQQRAVKRLSSDLGVEAVSLNYVVTPVRRSTRKSTCQYKSTPTSQVFSKLEEIAPGVLQAMMFQKNVALEPRE
ncbi:uncharacterized protein [Anabrus simplex]|uniref:uncharacterized protein n=1 Tax=Anabrus simplex TaxID=316456 RepID=UPI0035A373DE